MKNISKVLIANRGEIALRIIRACKELEILSVVVHSKVDTQGVWVKKADKAIELEPDFAKAYNNLGVAYKNQGNTTKAIQSFEKAARLGHKGAQDWLKKKGHDW